MRKSLLRPNGRGDRRRSPISFLTQDETKRLFATIKTKRDRAIFLTAYRHGLRASEISMLQRTDVDLKSGRLTIQRTKGSLSGIYAMQPDEIKALRAYVATRTDSSPYLFISNRTLPISRFTLLRTRYILSSKNKSLFNWATNVPCDALRASCTAPFVVDQRKKLAATRKILATTKTAVKRSWYFSNFSFILAPHGCRSLLHCWHTPSVYVSSCLHFRHATTSREG